MKKALLILILLFSLNFSFQPGYNLLQKERHSIVNIVNTGNDDYNGNFLNRNRKAKLKCLVVLKMSVLNADRILLKYNDSS